MLEWILERLATSTRADVVVVATSTLAADEPVAKLAGAHGVPVFRGSEQDVLDRYYRCAQAHRLDLVIRATADNPFVDVSAGDSLVSAVESGGVVYGCSEGYARGVGLEVMTFSALEQSWRDGHAPHHREHVNEYILENPQLFPQLRLPAPEAHHAPHLSLTVDTPEDFSRAERIYEQWLFEHAGPVPVTFACAVASRMDAVA